MNPNICLPFDNRDEGHLRLALFGVPYRGIVIDGYYRSRDHIPPGEAGFVQIGDIGGIVAVQFMPAVPPEST